MLADHLSGAGFDCELLGPEPGRASLLARLRGEAEGPTLCLLGHVDTVKADPDDWSFDPWAGDVVDGEVRGRGAQDMKGSTARTATSSGRDFLPAGRRFHDPHLRCCPDRAQVATSLPRQSSMEGPSRPSDTCGEYSDRKPTTSLPYARRPNGAEAMPGPFPAGTHGEVGDRFRIPSFDEQHYLSVCKAVAKPGSMVRTSACDPRRLNRRLTALIDELRARRDSEGWPSTSAATAERDGQRVEQRGSPRCSERVRSSDRAAALAGAECDRSVSCRANPPARSMPASRKSRSCPGNLRLVRSAGGARSTAVRRSASEELRRWLKDTAGDDCRAAGPMAPVAAMSTAAASSSSPRRRCISWSPIAAASPARASTRSKGSSPTLRSIGRAQSRRSPCPARSHICDRPGD